MRNQCYLCLLIYLTAFISIYFSLPASPPVYLSTYLLSLFACLTLILSLPTCLSICLSVYLLAVYLAHAFTCLSTSVCVAAFLSIYTPVQHVSSPPCFNLYPLSSVSSSVCLSVCRHVHSPLRRLAWLLHDWWPSECLALGRSKASVSRGAQRIFMFIARFRVVFRVTMFSRLLLCSSVCLSVRFSLCPKVNCCIG